MRIAGHLLVWSLITLSVVVPIVLLKAAGSQDAAIRGAHAGTSQPAPVYAGVPFVVRDNYATQTCVSTRAGQTYLPFVVPADAASGSSFERVQAGVPFVVRDSNGTQICISTRGGQALPPFILP